MVTNKKVKVPIYDFNIDVYIFDQWEEIAKYHTFNPYDNREGFIYTKSTTPNRIKLFVDVECPSCIVHEIIHIKNIIFETIGHTDIHNDEPEAYLVQYLYKKIINVYYKHKDNAKK